MGDSDGSILKEQIRDVVHAIGESLNESQWYDSIILDQTQYTETIGLDNLPFNDCFIADTVTGRCEWSAGDKMRSIKNEIVSLLKESGPVIKESLTTENPTKTQREPGGNPSLTQREPEHYSWEPLPADRGAVFKAFTKSDGCPNYSKIEHACAGMEAEEAGEFIAKLQAYEILKPVSDECGVSDEEMGAIRTRLIEIEGWDCKNQPVDVDKAADAMNRAIEKLDGKPSKLLQMPGCPWPRDGEFKAAVNEFRVNDDCLESFGPKLADGDDLADTS